jgi:hypothetical protein
MRGTVRNLLGLAAATAVIAVAVPATASPAGASAAAKPLASSVDYWGPYYSSYYNDSRVKVKGAVYLDEYDRVNVSGKLYDKGTPSYMCGYLQVKFGLLHGGGHVYTVKHCGTGYTPFRYWEYEAETVQVRACYWNEGQETKTLCGRWNQAYPADGHK